MVDVAITDPVPIIFTVVLAAIPQVPVTTPVPTNDIDAAPDVLDMLEQLPVFCNPINAVAVIALNAPDIPDPVNDT